MPTLKGGYHLADGTRVPSVTTILGRFKNSGALQRGRSMNRYAAALLLVLIVAGVLA